MCPRLPSLDRIRLDGPKRSRKGRQHRAVAAVELRTMPRPGPRRRIAAGCRRRLLSPRLALGNSTARRRPARQPPRRPPCPSSRCLSRQGLARSLGAKPRRDISRRFIPPRRRLSLDPPGRPCVLSPRFRLLLPSRRMGLIFFSARLGLLLDPSRLCVCVEELIQRQILPRVRGGHRARLTKYKGGGRPSDGLQGGN